MFDLGTFFPYGFIKIMVLLIMVMYLVFAGIIVRQEELMSKVIQIPSSPLLRIIAVIHLVLAIGVFFLALILL